jgi:hypothetical protein
MRLVKEPNDLSGNVLASCLLVVHDTGRGCEDDVTELTRWQQLDDPLLQIGETDVVAGRDDTSLVETVPELINAFLRARRFLTGHSTGSRSCRFDGHQPPRIRQYNLERGISMLRKIKRITSGRKSENV